MRFRVFGVRIVFIVALGCAVLLLQMLAVSQLSSQQSPERDAFQLEEQAAATPPHSPSPHNKLPLGDHKPNADQYDKNDEGGQVRDEGGQVRDGHRDRVVRHMLQNNTHFLPQRRNDGAKAPGAVWQDNGKLTTTLTTTTTPETTEETKPKLDIVKPFPVPAEHKNCNLDGKKDALSAISRASSKECKDLLHNVTCMQMAGLLYNTNIRRECRVKDSGRNFLAKPLSEVSGGARIVFLLSLHGRAIRQVKRLFKAIYHRDHYYFVHVDSRSDYLHRNLYETFSDFPNVYFPTWRIATIWGGASLLQMLLRSLQDLEFILTNWQWDYFINLSESDYPLRTNDNLVRFLKAHEGDNFVKTHGADINKFIQKQGLDRTFVECDNHMWRVDNRRLPGDITVDGGSDWIAIHRNYSRYLVTDRSEFLTGLKRYYEFSLLPAESFFHTVLRNGPMCHKFVKTNLRITNWNRKLGCRCQYKHIVDWCGCSPNDFLTKDLGRLQSPGDHNFFARKFEAIVSQEVINKLDAYLYGALPEGTPALESFWENVFNIEDDINYPYNAKYSTYQSYLRLALARLYLESKTAVGSVCEVPRQAVVKEVSVFMVSDSFKGLVVTLRDAMSNSLSPAEFEVMFTPVSFLQKYSPNDEVANRVYNFEVGSDWDGKESIFRNYGGILGAWDDPVIAIRLNPGKAGELSIVWDDPTGARVKTQNVKVESGWFVTFHKLKFDRPIRPGVWNTRLELLDGTAVMETQFLVVPLTHERMKPLENPPSVNAARTTSSVQSPVSESQEFSQWKENVLKTGESLEEWLDKLVADSWNMEGLCRTDADKDNCGFIRDCSTTDWSTYSPDPKSELGEVKQDGRLR